MNIYKAPNLIISPKRKVYRSGEGDGGGALNDKSIYTHTHALSFSLSPPPTHTHIYHSVRKRSLLGREKMRL